MNQTDFILNETPDEIDEDFIFEPTDNVDFEPLSAHLVLPRPSKLLDDQMEAYFPDRDGRWSRETKAAIAYHKAVGIDLNDNWALTWKGWACPACGRSKNEIFRLSKRGVLFAKLELHHDHIADFIWPRAAALLGQDWREFTAPGFGEAKYEKTVTCLTRDRDALLAFFDFPAEHWDHLRTSNPIESVFATVRHRTVRKRAHCLRKQPGSWSFP